MEASTQFNSSTPTPAGQSPAPQTANGQAVGAPPPSTDWMSGLNDEVKGYVQNKGFKDPSMVLDSYRNLEKLMGAPKERLLKLPENLEDSTAMNEIYARLGRPEKSDDYQIETPKEGGDPEFAKWAKDTFFKQGLNKAQAAQIVKGWNEYSQSFQQATAAKQNAAAAAEELDLKKQWGAAFDQNVSVAKRAATEFGFKPEEVDQLEKLVGFRRTLEIMHNIGSKVGEASFHSSGDRPGFNGTLTPEAALNKIQTLKQDPEFVNKYTQGDKNSLAEMERLMRLAYPSEE